MIENKIGCFGLTRPATSAITVEPLPAKLAGFVGAEGPRTAKIVILGEAPGSSEELSGRPFVGASGQLLDHMLANAGISRRDCYITNVVKYRPSKNDFSVYYEEKSKKTPKPELYAAWEAVRNEINAIKPNLTIALGSEALRALSGRKLSIESYRGTVIETFVGKTIPTYHPAYVLRMYDERVVVEMDLKRCLSESFSPEVSYPEVHCHLRPSLEECIAYLRSKPAKAAFDIETVGKTIRCIGFSSALNTAICMPFIKRRTSTILGSSFECYWSEDEERILLAELDQFLRDGSIAKIAQNYPFDATLLEREFGFTINGLIMDTMIASHTCYSELPKGLDFLCTMYTKHPYYSDHNVNDDDSEWFYNCMDALVTFEIEPKLRQEMIDLGVSEFYDNHCQPLMLALARASNYGPLVDVEARNKMKVQYEAELEEIKKKLLGLTGFALNPNSPKQMASYFYTTLKVKPVISRKTHAPTLDEDALKVLQNREPRIKPLIDLVLLYREKAKLIGTFLSSILNADNRMHTSYNAAGTVTGRISSSKTLIEQEGGNLQQIPRGDFRRIFIAPPGMVLLKADLSQAEARYVAWAAKIHSLIKKFGTPGFDVHKWNGSIVFGKPESEISKDERQTSKSLVHGANYGLGARKAAQISGVPFEVAKRALDRYRAELPEIQLWHAGINEQIITSRRMKTPLGRQRIFQGRLDDETFRSGYAFGPQSTIGDIINRGFFLLNTKLPSSCRLVLQVHDELVIECPETLLHVVARMVKDVLEIPIVFPGIDQPLVIPAELKVGKNWFDMETFSL